MTLLERLGGEEQRVREFADDLADVADRLRELVKAVERMGRPAAPARSGDAPSRSAAEGASHA